MDRLARYRTMRDFRTTPKPVGGVPSKEALRYSMQIHDATRLHWDLSLEWQVVLLSWAVTRGPSTNPTDKRLAVRTEDHPMDYLTFKGTIPKGNYGTGTVMLWNSGWWQPFQDVTDGLADGHLNFALHGRRATAGWSLIRLKDRVGSRENWLMVKDSDAAANKDPVPFSQRHNSSITSNRAMAEIATGASARPYGSIRRGAVPPFRAPQLAETVETPPDCDAWLHEVKLDGYRAQVAIGARVVRVRTRSGVDWSDRFAELLPALAGRHCDTALIDGEVMAGAGLSGFTALQAAIKGRRAVPILCF